MRQGRDTRRRTAISASCGPGVHRLALSPDGFRWIYDALGSDIWLFSASGGSDVCTAFLAGCPTLPVYEGELQCRALGAKVESFDEDGHAILDEVGELC